MEKVQVETMTARVESTANSRSDGESLASTAGSYRAIEFSATLLSVVLFAVSIFVSATHILNHDIEWVIPIAMLAAWAISDVITGIIHWGADTYGSEDIPIIGQAFLRPFREHHTFPKAICSHDLVTLIGNACIGAVPTLLLFLFLIWEESISKTRAFMFLLVVLVVGGTVVTNLFHKWAHADAPPRLARLLQKMRVILGARHHDIHHEQPHNSHYCITNGWMNPLLDRIRFFRALEFALAKLGLHPHTRRVDVN